MNHKAFARCNSRLAQANCKRLCLGPKQVRPDIPYPANGRCCRAEICCSSSRMGSNRHCCSLGFESNFESIGWSLIGLERLWWCQSTRRPATHFLRESSADITLGCRMSPIHSYYQIYQPEIKLYTNLSNSSLEIRA